ncbi:hypothetical protein [Acetivibrio clariflavus]|uniref:hypothetical protein n=1 Tax=Acetivibrio clariflavus TaxID=288965 RepID=UPI0004850EE3|nr:hypothetical protein [Acetivibrio clariflavus]
MKDNKEQCNHKYIIDYSFRKPSLFFHSLPCDICKQSINLSLPWRIIYWIVDIMGFVLAYIVSTSIHIKFLGNTFIASILIFVLLIWFVQLIIKLIFKYGKWVEVAKK